MTINVADIRANLNENIRHAARIISRSKARRAVFEAIYRGKKQLKTVDDLIQATGLSQVRVLQEAGKLAGNQIVEKVKVDGRLAYKKVDAYTQHKDKVLDLVDHPNKRSRYPTKQEPKAGPSTTYRITVARSQTLPEEVTIDEIEGFAQVGLPRRARGSNRLSDVPEVVIKRFLKAVIGEPYDFKDWGGEKNDLYTNKLRFRGVRHTAAFAIKGRATRPPLTPKKMGKNGDQIGRLLSSEAEVFMVVFHGKVDQTIHEQLRAYALGRSLGGNRVFYGVIDGSDLGRLVHAYPNEFRAARRG